MHIYLCDKPKIGSIDIDIVVFLLMTFLFWDYPMGLALGRNNPIEVAPSTRKTCGMTCVTILCPTVNLNLQLLVRCANIDNLRDLFSNIFVYENSSLCLLTHHGGSHLVAASHMPATAVVPTCDSIC